MRRALWGCGILFLAVALLSAGGCRRPATLPEGAAPTSALPEGGLADDLGRAWQGPLPASRVVSLAPNATEIVCALGAADRLAGVDTASDYPPAVASIQRVGDFLRPSVERIVSLRPDVVILSSATVTESEAAEFAARLRAPVFVLRPRRLPDVAQNVRAVARLLDLPEQGEAVAAAMESRLAAVEQAVVGRPPRKVFLEVWHEPLTTVGPGTVLDDLIRLAGGINVAAAQPKQFPTFSLEALLGADPEVYVFTAMGGATPTGPDPAKRPGFGSLRAVRTGRVYRIAADPVLRPTPRVAEGAEALARAIHPEGFR